MNLRTKDGVQIILHLGAKTRDTATASIVIDDPEESMDIDTEWDWMIAESAIRRRDLRESGV